MVNDRSDYLRFRTGIHGGLRRGSAAAAIGAVLVLAAGVPASQADVVPDSGDPEVQVTGAVPLPEIGGLLQGLLGTSGTATSPQPTPVPTTAPTTVSPAPTTSSSSGAAAIPQEAVTGASVPSQQQPGTAGGQPGTLPAGQGAPQAAEAPATAQDAAGQPAGQPAAGPESPAAVQSTASAPSPAVSRASGSGTLQAAGGPARGRHEMAPARDADPAGEAAKVWVGVGLVGSAGAAGLVLTRIRRF